jgi:hypothetical protein
MAKKVTAATTLNTTKAAKINGIFDEIWWYRRCNVRILIVCDGGIDYSTNDFGLSELITKALNTSGRPNVTFTITKAHRSSGAGADITGFTFTTATLNTTLYDECWLFAVNGGGSLPIGEVQAISTFMNSGGGMFATGDHENLGLFMCGELPRIRSMRKWYWPTAPAGRLVAPDGSSANRHDTSLVGDTANYQFDDQSDETPQTMIPKYYTNGTSSYVHPLLQKTGGVINVLPDHAHEGECVVPANLTEAMYPGSADPEYPFLSGSTTQRVVPDVVAISYSGAGYLTDAGKPAVNPKCFGAIGAYDGHLAQGTIGRVSVDATWHHFLNINLNGVGSSRPETGFYDSMENPLPVYEDIKRYYRNIAIWLAPKALQKCFRMRYIYYLRYSFPLIWELRESKDFSIPGLRMIGAQVVKAINDQFGEAEAISTVLAIAEGLSESLQQIIRDELNPYVNVRSEKATAPAVSSDELLRRNTLAETLLGGVLQNIRNETPFTAQEFESILDAKYPDEKLDSILVSGLAAGFTSYAEGMAALSEKALRYNKVFSTAAAEIKRMKK